MDSPKLQNAVKLVKKQQLSWRRNRWIFLVMGLSCIVFGMVAPQMVKAQLIELYTEQVEAVQDPNGTPWSFDRIAGGMYLDVYVRSLWVSHFTLISGVFGVCFSIFRWRGSPYQVPLLELARRAGIESGSSPSSA